MTKTKKRILVILGAVVALCLAVVLIITLMPKAAAPTTIKAGESSELSIPISVNESSAYAGIEFALEISDESALTFLTFTPAPELAGAMTSPFMTKDNLHYFGYFSGTNGFPSGEMVVGTLVFTDYTGDQPVTITVVKMSVTRLDKNNQTVTTEKTSPAYIFDIER